MRTTFIEATSKQGNWGKFMIGRFDADELERRSVVDGGRFVQSRGWDPRSHVLVMDMQTGEGAMFRLGGYAKADLEKHKIWVCVLFEAFLQWIYEQPDLDMLPASIELDVPLAFAGYRRTGCDCAQSEVRAVRDERIDDLH